MPICQRQAQKLLRHVELAVLAVAALLALEVTPAAAAVITYTSSATFSAAASPNVFETYATGTNGHAIANGGSFDGLTYSFSTGTDTAANLTGGILTNAFNSFSGLSLGGTQSTGQDFFFGGNSITVIFPSFVSAVGVFFNVNANSGTYSILAPVGDATTNSTSYDTRTFVFDGLTSTTPFDSVTFESNNVTLGSFNIPEIEYTTVPTSTVPEPFTLSLFGAGLAGAFAIRRRKAKA